MTDALMKRAVRRELHSPRTVATVVVLLLFIVAVAYCGVEIVLRRIGAPALLTAPEDALRWLATVHERQPQAGVIIVGALVALAGVILLWLGISPGRRARHQIQSTKHSVVVDNAVIASAVAESARRALDLPRGGVVVGIGHRRADLTIRPEPGQNIDKERVRAIADEQIAGYALATPLTVRVRTIANKQREDV